MAVRGASSSKRGARNGNGAVAPPRNGAVPRTRDVDPVVILNQLNRRVHATQDVDEVCLLHLEAIVERMGYEAGMVALLNRGRAALEGRIAMNCDETLVRQLDVSI